MALGRGYALPFIAGKQGGGGAGGAYGLLWQEAINANVPPMTAEDFDAGQGSCLFTRGKSLYDAVGDKPSLLIVPQMRGSGKLAVDIPSPMFFDVTRATTATRVNSSGLIESVASGVPRLDWYATPAAQDAAATGCPALLVEASGTNLCLRSQELSTSPWIAANVTVTGTTLTNSPDGTQNAFDITISSAAFSNLRQPIACANNTTYTVSCFYKNKSLTSGQTFEMRYTNELASPNNLNAIATIDLAAGTATFAIAGTSGTGYSGSATGRVDNYGNGWYRVSMTFTVGSAGGNANGIFRPAIGIDITRNFYAWGAQLETSAAASTYIPTTTAAVTRNADVINASGSTISGLIGQTEGTIYAEVVVRLNGSTASKRVFAVDDGTTDNRVAIEFQYYGSPLLQRVVTDVRQGASEIYSMASTNTGASITADGVMKIAFAYKNNDYATYVNGVLVSGTTSGSGTLSNLTASAVRIGSRPSNLNQLNDRIRAAAIYTTRLSNDELAQLTT